MTTPEHGQYADPDEVAEFASQLPDDYLQCRELGHVWRPHTAQVAEGYYERRLRCPRCKMVREDQVSMSGQILRRSYDDTNCPDYYAKHIGRIVGEGRGQLRLASILRTVAATDERAEKRRTTRGRGPKVA